MRTTTLLIILIMTFNFVYAKSTYQIDKPVDQQEAVQNTKIRFDGLYITKTGEINVEEKIMDIFTYIRFYEDGSVYTQAVNSYDPKAVSKWFGKDGRFERKGNYILTGTEIKFTVTNDESPDKNLEGQKTDKYNGKITDENKLFVNIRFNNAKSKDYRFEFVKDVD